MTTLLAALLGLVLHEAAHSYAADLLGDPSPRVLGRVTLNPLAHLDPVGSVLLPVALAILGLPPMGYGRSAPVASLALEARDYIAALLAGPAVNLVLAGFLFSWWREGALINLGLGLFNLTPIPPLDGGRVVLTLWRHRA